MRGESDCFIWVESSCPSQQFFSHVRMISWVEPVLSNEDKVSCSRSEQCAPGDQGSGTIPNELAVLPNLSASVIFQAKTSI